MNIFDLDLHPISVHFPIALLSLYCVLEFISFGKIREYKNLIFTKSLLATLGGLSLLVARQFGERAAEELNNSHLKSLIEMHEQFSTYTVLVFGVIGIVYLLVLISEIIGTDKLQNFQGYTILMKAQAMVTQTLLANLLALVGFILLLITGALGGAIVYGPNADPFTKSVYQLLL